VAGWPDYACRGCSFWADQVAHVAHLNARDTTLVSASRASQADIARLKAKMGWDMPGTLSRTASTSILGWTSGTATTCSSATATGSIAPTSSTAAATRRWGRPGATSTSPPRSPGGLGGFARGLSPDAAVQVVELARQLRRRGLA
jgi:hypothetical protein